MAGRAFGVDDRPVIGLMVKVVKLPEMVEASSPQRPFVYAIFFGMVLASALILEANVSLILINKRSITTRRDNLFANGRAK